MRDLSRRAAGAGAGPAALPRAAVGGTACHSPPVSGLGPACCLHPLPLPLWDSVPWGSTRCRATVSCDRSHECGASPQGGDENRN